MKDLKIKIITGFRKDQYYTIDAEEAHKAYYLFLNPEERGVFNNGVAMIGKNVQGIEPDYHATMGWNSTHTLDSDDSRFAHFFRSSQNFNTLNSWGLYDYPILEES